MIQTTIYLASQSPRRVQLLEESGFSFKQLKINVEEKYPDELPSEKIAAYLANLKAEAAAHLFSELRPILTADSIVIQNGKVLEKPSNRTDAFEMLKELSGKTHFVDTGFSIVTDETTITNSVRSKVYMSTLSEEEINYYIDHYNPYDKAGSYGIQEWIGHCKISKIEGSYTNIMGLPMKEVYDAFRQIDRRIKN